MTYIVSSGALNSTHSLTPTPYAIQIYLIKLSAGQGESVNQKYVITRCAKRQKLGLYGIKYHEEIEIKCKTYRQLIHEKSSVPVLVTIGLRF